jgi:transglutaminase-like putative cysteine protease
VRVLPGLVLFVVSVEAAAPTPLPMPEPARLTPEMLVWLDARVPRVGSDDAVLDALLVTLVTDPELALNYDPGFTAPAAEVFAQGRFNCLSFAHLFLGMARTRGIPVEYLQVPPRRFVRDGDLVLASATGGPTLCTG